MSSLNKVTLIGNVGIAPEVKMMQNGSKVANFSIATNESWKDRNGEKKDHTEWHRVSVYGDKIVDVVEKYVKKGTKLYIEGSIRTNKYTDDAGIERKSFQIVVQGFSSVIKILDSRSDSAGAIEDDSYSESSSGRIDDRIDDSIPF